MHSICGSNSNAIVDIKVNLDLSRDTRHLNLCRFSCGNYIQWSNFSGTFYFFMLLSFLYNIFNFYGEGYPAIRVITNLFHLVLSAC